MENKKKILYVTLNNIFSLKSGGEYTSNRNYLILKKIGKTDLLLFNNDFKEKIENTFFFPRTRNKYETFYYLLFGRFCYHKKYEKEIIKVIQKNKYEIIFLDSSLFGFLCQKIKKIFPEIKVISFFHNIEYNFFKERAKVENKLYYLMFFVGYLNERKTIQNADKIIVLNAREKKELKKIYKKEADYILPLSFKDNFNKEKMRQNKLNYLFLGTNFYANYEGIKWFVNNVMQELKGKLYVVGKDFEKAKKELEVLPNVIVIGTVERTEEWYYKIPIVISPIFSGAGMKTKIAEALMYGKYIFGTTEAFEGYDIEFDKVGGLCNTKEEFVKKIKEKEKEIEEKEFNFYARNIFLNKYSWSSTEKQFIEIINNV